MSWQAYVDDQLVGAGLTGGVLLGHDGSVWASKNFNIQGTEGAGLANLFKNPANVFATGIFLGGNKYMGIKGDERSIYGKKGATGVATAKTGQAIIIGYYDEKVQPGNAAVIVEKLADYLIDNGY